MNYYPFHLGDYAAHTSHLDPLEDLAYRRMLDAYYLHEGPLPSDVQEVARLIRMRGSLQEVEAVLKEFFSLDDSGWRHARCDEELGRMQDKQAKARASAVASVNARRANAERALNERSPNVERTLSERPADVELPTPTPTPTPNGSVTNVTGGEPPLPQDIVFGLGVPLLTAASIKESNARSFLAMQSKAHGAEKVSEALQLCAAERPLEPVSWLQARLGPIKGMQKQSKHSGFALKNYREGVTDDGFLA